MSEVINYINLKRSFNKLMHLTSKFPSNSDAIWTESLPTPILSPVFQPNCFKDRLQAK